MVGKWFKSLVEGAPEALSELCFPRGGTDKELITPDDFYVSIRINKIKVGLGRRGSKRYYGCVYAQVRLADEKVGEAIYHVVQTPDYLKGVDASALSRVIVKDVSIVDAVPYRGNLKLELGLVLVPAKDGDLVAPYLEFLSGVAEVSGAGFIKTALGFVQPIQRGFDILCGARNDVELEVGIQRGFETLTPATYVLGRGESMKGATLNEDSSLIGGDGRIIEDLSYVVFTISALRERLDWAKIPEIREAHDLLMGHLARQEDDVVRKTALPHFRAVCLASSDLISADAERLVEKVEARVKKISKTRMVAKEKARSVWSLEEIDLYGDTTRSG